MKPIECELESEVLAAVLQNRWPERVDIGLHQHVVACPICADVVAIAGAIDNAREEMRARAVVPDSGRVWWLAQMRARREAAQTAGRPITAAQVIALACAVGLLGACFGATSGWFQSALRRTASSLRPSGCKRCSHSPTCSWPNTAHCSLGWRPSSWESPPPCT